MGKDRSSLKRDLLLPYRPKLSRPIIIANLMLHNTIWRTEFGCTNQIHCKQKKNTENNVHIQYMNALYLPWRYTR